MTTWTPKTQQAETWTERTEPVRVFSPHVFARRPVFDTGFTGGIWDEQSQQTETWTEA